MNNYFCTNSGRKSNCPPQQQTCQTCPPQQSCQTYPTENCQTQNNVHPCCACVEALRKALDLVCCPQLQEMVDAATFATDHVLGTPMGEAPTGTAPADNLTDRTPSAPLSAAETTESP